MTKKHSFEFVKNYIENKGWKLHSKEYINVKSKLNIECPKGHKYSVRFNSFKSGHRCRICYNEKQRFIFNYIKNYIKNKNYKLLSIEYINIRKKLKLKCPKGHEFPMSFNQFKNMKSRCPYCNIENQKHTFEFVKKYIEKQRYELISVEYINAHNKLKLKCPKGHEYPVNFNNFKNGQRCPYCNIYRNQEKCRKIFEQLTNKKFPKTRPKWIRNPKTNYLLELDGYCRELKIAFEYDGIQHFEEHIFFHKHKNCSLKNIQERDRLKDQLCLKNGVKLLRIKYKVKNKEKFIKRFLIKNNIKIILK